MKHASELFIRNVGPLVDAQISMGDLTVFIGPQASGKSIALQWLKLVQDADSIKAQLLAYGTDWASSEQEFLNLYFGEGMSSIWSQAESKVAWNGAAVDLEKLVRRKSRKGDETVFLIPAQRVLSLREGWPRPFGDYGTGDPYNVRAYSERLRLLMEAEFGVGVPLFPRPNRLKADYRSMLSKSIFGGFNLAMTRTQSRKRLVLQKSGNDLPYMVWSAGQREFVPLLLGMYWLMPPSKVPTRDKIKWVIIEELEMGLHPQAISTVLLLVLELISRGYRVCLSTHSPQVLDLVWAWQTLAKDKNAKAADLLDVLGARHTQSLRGVATNVLRKAAKVYYFESGKRTLEISGLSPDSSTSAEATWGGLLESSSKANEVVAKSMANVQPSLLDRLVPNVAAMEEPINTINIKMPQA